jgi:hypothetical protein
MRSNLQIFAALFLFFLLGTTGRALCQHPGTHRNTTDQNKSHWVAGLTYLSNNVFLGRQDSVKLPYLSPSIGYHDKSGLFINGSFSYSMVPGDGRIDVISFEGGWAHYTDHFNAELSASKDFYSAESFSVKSEISGYLSGYFSYDFGPLEPSLDLGADVGSSFDFALGLGLEHSFTLVENILELDPSVKANASTQNFYSNYYNKRRYSAKRKNNAVSTTTAEVLNAANFQLMDYELSTPLEYTYRKKLKLNFTPTYAIPVNPATILTTTSGNNSSSSKSKESLPNVFYFSLGVSYKF